MLRCLLIFNRIANSHATQTFFYQLLLSGPIQFFLHQSWLFMQYWDCRENIFIFQDCPEILTKKFSLFDGSFPLRFFTSPLPSAISIDITEEVGWSTVKRDPGSSARKQRFREHARPRSRSSVLVEENDATRTRKGRKRRRGRGEERERKSVERNRMERPVYLDDSPACFARRPYETG